MLHYNSDLFKEAGLKNPGELKAAGDWTWQRLQEAAVAIGKREGDHLVTQGFMTDRQVYTWMAFAFNNNGVFVADDRKTFSIDSQPSADALQFLADFIQKYKVSPTLTDQQGGDYVPRFSTGRLAMMATWAGTAGDVRAVVGDKFQFDVIEPPPFKALAPEAVGAAGADVWPQAAANPERTLSGTRPTTPFRISRRENFMDGRWSDMRRPAFYHLLVRRAW